MRSDFFQNDFSPKTEGWNRLWSDIQEQDKQDQASTRFWQTAAATLVFFLLGFKSYDNWSSTQALPQSPPDVVVSGRVAKEIPTHSPKVRFFIARNH